MENITQKEQELALISLKSLSEIAEKLVGQQEIHLLVEQTKQTVIIPKKAFLLLSSIVTAMSENKNVLLLASETEITTQEAANMLQISRPHLIKLLEKNEIFYRKVGNHRRILINDIIIIYQEKQLEKQLEKQKESTRKNLEFLTKQAQKLNLGY